MANLQCFTGRVEVHMTKGVSIADISEQLEEIVRQSQIDTGSLHATSIGSTGSLTCIEYEPGVVADLIRAVTELAPPHRDYEHERAWADGNGHSHVQAALLGPSLVLPVRAGRCAVGTWQQAVVINHDVKPRTRKIDVTVMGA